MPSPSKSPSRAIARRPLPDAQAIRALAVPDLAPPFDDSEPARPSTQVTEPLPDGQGTTVAGASRSDPQPVPLTGTWPSQFAQVLSETLAGSRPASQLNPWTTERARERISQLGPLLAASRQPRVRRVIITSPVQGVLEMTVIVDIGSRSRAVAVRLERPSPATPPITGQSARPAAWLCTAVEAA